MKLKFTLCKAKYFFRGFNLEFDTYTIDIDRTIYTQIGLVSSSSAISPSTFFATAAALIQNKNALDMRSRAQMHELPNNSGGDLGMNDDNLNKRHLREYLHVPGKPFFYS